MGVKEGYPKKGGVAQNRQDVGERKSFVDIGGSGPAAYAKVLRQESLVCL